MYAWFDAQSSISSRLAEDVGAPELRNPRHSAMRSKGFLRRLFSARP